MPRSNSRDDADPPYRPRYVYRRELSARELLPAVGAAMGAGLAVFWIARLFLQRTPLVASPVSSPPVAPEDAPTPARTPYRLPG